MKKLSAIFALLTLVCSFAFLGFLKIDVAATVQENASQVGSVTPGGNTEEVTPAQTQETTATSAPAQETVYATTDVNVRTGPGTKHAIIGVLKHGKSIVRIEAGSNGWSKVIFEDSEGYARSRYLSNTKPAQTKRVQDHAVQSFDETSIAFESVDENVYAITDVNVRVGPGTQYEALGCCSYGECVQRTGIGENGWSKVIFEGETAYIRSSYLSTSKPVADSYVGSGMYGRLTIPSIGVNVPLYYCTSDSGSGVAQAIADAKNSAVFMDQTSIEGAIIADHKNQAFRVLRYCAANVTYAYIDYGSHTQAYICTAIGLGHNREYDMVDWNGNSLNYDSIPGGLAMYTCDDNWQNVIITYWSPV